MKTGPRVEVQVMGRDVFHSIPKLSAAISTRGRSGKHIWQVLASPHKRAGCRQRGALLIEVLVYMALLFAIVGLGYAAMYNCIDHSVVLRNSAEDITRALDAGELWRSDVREARRVRMEDAGAQQILHLVGKEGEVTYRSSTNTVSRRVASGPWTLILANVKTSLMQVDQREKVTAWCWELELNPRTKASVKPGRVRPLFTFIAVPQTGGSL
jgi:hypothetical protein